MNVRIGPSARTRGFALDVTIRWPATTLSPGRMSTAHPRGRFTRRQWLRRASVPAALPVMQGLLPRVGRAGAITPATAGPPVRNTIEIGCEGAGDDYFFA